MLLWHWSSVSNMALSSPSMLPYSKLCGAAAVSLWSHFRAKEGTVAEDPWSFRDGGRAWVLITRTWQKWKGGKKPCEASKLLSTFYKWIRKHQKNKMLLKFFHRIPQKPTACPTAVNYKPWARWRWRITNTFWRVHLRWSQLHYKQSQTEDAPPLTHPSLSITLTPSFSSV